MNLRWLRFLLYFVILLDVAGGVMHFTLDGGSTKQGALMLAAAVVLAVFTEILRRSGDVLGVQRAPAAPANHTDQA